jgi:hypothetical protein
MKTPLTFRIFTCVLFSVVLLVACSKENYRSDEEDITYYTGMQLSKIVDSLKTVYNSDLDYEFSETSIYSGDILCKLEKIISCSSSKSKTRSIEFNPGDDDELLIHCITAYSGDGGDNVIGNNYNDTDNVSIHVADGYHKPGESGNILHNNGGRYLSVSFDAFLLPWIYISFKGVVEQTTERTSWVEESVTSKGGIWEWNPGNLYYYYNDVALASEYNGTKKVS